MQHPIHSARHARPAAVLARAGVGPSCAVMTGAPRGTLASAGAGIGTGSGKFGRIAPEARVRCGFWMGQDRRERYRQRGRTVARP